jgi:hypothetical protein
MNKNDNPCTRDCPRRCVGCHGKDETGAWRCKEWGEYEEAKAPRKGLNPLYGYIVERANVRKHRKHRSHRR